MKLISITKRADFLTIGKVNFRFYSKSVLLIANKTAEKYLTSPKDNKVNDFCRIGYTVSKSVGNAVKRNRSKRRYRGAFRNLYQDYALNHFDYVILARKEVADMEYKEIRKDLKYCLKGIKKLVNSGAKAVKKTRK